VSSINGHNVDECAKSCVSNCQLIDRMSRSSHESEMRTQFENKPQRQASRPKIEI
jgi:hypothetical protein